MNGKRLWLLVAIPASRVIQWSATKVLLASVSIGQALVAPHADCWTR